MKTATDFIIQYWQTIVAIFIWAVVSIIILILSIKIRNLRQIVKAQKGHIWSGPDMIEGTQTAHVKFFRQEIAKYMKKFDSSFNDNDVEGKDYLHDYLWQSRISMIEAKHWLGWELDRIRKEKEPLHAGSTSQPPLPL